MGAAALIAAASGQGFMVNHGTADVSCDSAALAASIASAPSGATLDLTASCRYVLTAALPAIAKDLTIKGNGAVLERNSASAPFTILTAVSGTIAISDLDFTNGGSGPSTAPGSDSFSGGAIDIGEATLTVTNGTFTGNTAAAGGAIENEGGTLTVTGTAFLMNGAKFGGGIDNESVGTLNGATFVANTAASFGGGVAGSYDTTVTGATFSRNLAGFGGGLWNEATAKVSDTTFTANAAGAGGAIGNNGGLTLSGGSFTSNSASTNGGALAGFQQAHSDLSGTSLRLNTAGTGGGIYNEDAVSLTGVTISHNTAHGKGGGVYTNWLMTAASSSIVSNTATVDGGGIYNGDDFGPPGTVSLTGSTVAANQPDDCQGCAAASVPRRLLPRHRHGTEAQAGLRAAEAAYARTARAAHAG